MISPNELEQLMSIGDTKEIKEKLLETSIDILNDIMRIEYDTIFDKYCNALISCVTEYTSQPRKIVVDNNT